MTDLQEETSSGKINWPLVILASLALHAVVLGGFWYLSGEGWPAKEQAKEGELLEPSQIAQTPDKPSDDPADEVKPVDKPAPAQSEFETYTVKSGDYLSKIASKYGTTVDYIKELNGLKSTNLQIGQKLKVPAKAAGEE